MVVDWRDEHTEWRRWYGGWFDNIFEADGEVVFRTEEAGIFLRSS
jgi:hypothetical protein